VVRVADRFGDYGLVGVVLYETEADRCKVDSLLLSCRVLGRGVEHAVVSWLGQRAVNEGKRFVQFTYVPTEKNLPALQFITSIGDQYRNDGDTSWTFPAERLAGVEYNPEDKAPIPEELTATPKGSGDRPAMPLDLWRLSGRARSERLQQVGEDLSNIDRLGEAIERYRLTQQPLHATTDLTPRNTLETALTNIWRKVLGRPHIGLNDNFFEAGGTSLRAVQVIAMIKKELKKTLSIVTLFECPTIKLLGAKLNADQNSSDGPSNAGAPEIRGQQRRHKAIRRRTTEVPLTAQNECN
jgi:acyl carrier protein